MKLIFVTLILHLVSVDSSTCTNVANWKDSDGDGCNWYAVNASSRCKEWGNCCKKDGHTAVTACCVCGGGVTVETNPTKSPTKKPTQKPTKSPIQTPTIEPICSNVPNWKDSDGDGCNWYTNNDPGCKDYGDCCKNQGYTANTACCFCGGGIISTLKPVTEPPTKAPVTKSPTRSPVTSSPTSRPTKSPTKSPTRAPTAKPTLSPKPISPTEKPSKSPTRNPTKLPTKNPITAPPTKTPTKAPVEPICSNVPNWKDSDGDGCNWYVNNDPGCDDYGDCCKKQGHTANTACCFCGGGILTYPDPPTKSPIAVRSPTETPTRQPVQDGSLDTGDSCLADDDCQSGICENGACMATSSCKILKHDGGQFSEKRVNIVFIGSAFEELEDWRVAVNNAKSDFEEFEMFRDDNDLFNVFYVDEIFDNFCFYNCGGIDRLLCCNTNLAHEYSSKCFPPGSMLQTVVVQNSVKYGGAGYASLNIATTSLNSSGPQVAVHELGHSLFELADEYNSGSGTDNSPNCGNNNCDKFSDLVSALSNVSCEIAGCRDGKYFIGENSLMRYLNYPMGDVNLRFTCCSYQALTKEMPAYCSKYEFTNGYLLSYCQKDYQGYGSDSYNDSDMATSNRRSRSLSENDAKYTLVDKPEILSLDVDGNVVSIHSSSGNNSPQLYRAANVFGDFDSIDEAILTEGVPNILQITATFESGEPQVIYLNRRVEVDIPPAPEGSLNGRSLIDEPGTIFVEADTYGVVIDAAQTGKGKLVSVTSEVVDTRSVLNGRKRRPKKKANKEAKKAKKTYK